jgi:hypothetical protein
MAVSEEHEDIVYSFVKRSGMNAQGLPDNENEEAALSKTFCAVNEDSCADCPKAGRQIELGASTTPECEVSKDVQKNEEFENVDPKNVQDEDEEIMIVQGEHMESKNVQKEDEESLNSQCEDVEPKNVQDETEEHMIAQSEHKEAGESEQNEDEQSLDAPSDDVEPTEGVVMGLAFTQEPDHEQIRLHLKRHGWEASCDQDLVAFSAEYSLTCLLEGAFAQMSFQTLAQELAGYRMLKAITSSSDPTQRARVR